MTPVTPVLEIDRLSVQFVSEKETVDAVRDLSLHIDAGQTLALVGESGSGKTVTAQAILKLLPLTARLISGSIRVEGEEVLPMTQQRIQSLRGDKVAMIFQEPMTALNPLYTIGHQLSESLILHRNLSSSRARLRAIELLELTQIHEPHRRIDAYPHQLSGGQRQRVMIAMAMACNPTLLIADEPTTALDVTIQAQILELLKKLQQERNLAILLITHDLPMVEKMADHVAVMQHGKILETATQKQLFSAPKHAYTQRLLNSLPQPMLRSESERQETPRPLYTARNIQCHFPIKQGLFRRTVGVVKAVDGIHFTLRKGRTLGVIGESGSGKTTLGEAILGLVDCTGERFFLNKDLNRLRHSELRALRKRMQIVFQDPFSSLSPRLTIGQILEEGLTAHHIEESAAQRRHKITKILEEVGLSGASLLERYPHEFSGGQRQRIAIARAMVLQPELLVLDEPTSALDLSVQAQILSLLKQLQKDHQLAYLFISHDLRVIRAIAHTVIILQQGRVVAHGETQTVFENPKHPYACRLLSQKAAMRPQTTRLPAAQR